MQEVKCENNIPPDHLFPIGYGILQALFTHLWKLSMDFILTQLSANSDTPVCNHILPSFYKSGLISTIYNKYNASFIEIILLPASNDMEIP